VEWISGCNPHPSREMVVEKRDNTMRRGFTSSMTSRHGEAMRSDSDREASRAMLRLRGRQSVWCANACAGGGRRTMLTPTPSSPWLRVGLPYFSRGVKRGAAPRRRERPDVVVSAYLALQRLPEISASIYVPSGVLAGSFHRHPERFQRWNRGFLHRRHLDFRIRIHDGFELGPSSDRRHPSLHPFRSLLTRLRGAYCGKEEAKPILALKVGAIFSATAGSRPPH